MKFVLTWWKEYRYKWHVLGIGGLLILAFFSFLLFPNEKKEEIVLIDAEDVEKEVVESKPEMIKVDIKGAILKPGLYELEAGSRVQDVIEKSGGLNVDADTSMINLSKVLEDEMVVIIYTKDEIQALEEGNTNIKYIEKECICPSIENDACIEKSEGSMDDAINEESTSLVSLNHATLEELMTLPGIGEVKAQAILDYREESGNFNTIEELKNVKGIGDSTFEKLKDYITI